MKKVLLVNPSYRNSYGGSVASLANPVFPVLSLASLAAVAKSTGAEVEILDFCWREYSADVFEAKVKHFKPDIIGFTVLTPSVNQVRDMSCAVKLISKKIITVAGGSHVTALPFKSLKESLLDIIIISEGEITFEEILTGKKLEDILGIVYRDTKGIIHQNQRRQAIKILDDLPIPLWEQFNFKDYKKNISKLYTKRYPFVSVEFSRGCVYKCDFCASKLSMFLGYRKKTPKRCAQEVLHLKNIGVKEFMLTDDIFTSDTKWAKDVCRELIKINTGIIWTCANGIRVESADLELFTLMKKAGCYRVAFGFESGNDEVLKSFGKGGKASLKTGRTAVKLAKKAGLEVHGYFLIGLSDDTKETIEETIMYARTLPLDLLKFGVTLAFPGTRMFNRYKERGLIKSFNWDNYHMYSGSDLFTHESLTKDEINLYIKKAYRKTTFLSLSFILRRLIYSIKSMSFLLQITSFFKYLFYSYTSKESSLTYKYQNIWPKDIDEEEMEKILAI